MNFSLAVRAAAIGLALFPAAAFPVTYYYSAQTSTTAHKQGPVAAGGIQWKCAGNRCTASGPWATPSVKSCRDLALQVGRITAFGHAKKYLGAGELLQCNAGIVTAPPRIMTQITPRPMLAPALAPAPAPKPAPKPATPTPSVKPAGRTGPATFTSLPLTVTGTGALSSRGPFSPRSFTTTDMTVTGTGALAERAPFSPKTFSTEGLTVTGTGALN